MDRCFVVGTGPSLNGVDYSLLDGEDSIAINHAVRFFEPTAVFWSDHDLEPELTEAILKSEASRWSLDERSEIPDTFIAKKNGGPTNDIDDGLFYVQNSGLPALNLAILMEYEEIYLLGIDMGHDNITAHCYPDGRWIANCIYEYQAKFFDYFHHDRYGIDMPMVYNCSPISNIKCFPFKDIREVLNGKA